MSRSVAFAMMAAAVLAAGCACKKAPATPATTAAVEPQPQPQPQPEPEPKPQPEPVAIDGPPAGTGIDSCDDYIGVILQMETACAGKIPQESLDALKQGRDAMLQSFPSWDTMDPATRDSTRAAMTDACGQARDALRQASASLGCPV